MKRVLQTLFDGQNLARTEAMRAMGLVLEGGVPSEQVAAFLGALRGKRETVEEIAGFAEALRARGVSVLSRRRDLVDTCGTGGDGAETFNISTTVAFVVAGAGLGVAKHGNRSVSSRCGSADVLETLGVPIDLEPEAAARELESSGFAFLFAPNYHPAMKNAAMVRRAIGVRTVFNILGPLANPASVRRQVVGVYDARLLMPLAEVLRDLGADEALVVCGEDGLDELTTTAPTRTAHLKEGRITTSVVTPEDSGLPRASLESLKGGDANVNARIVEGVLQGTPGPARDIVLLNAGAALMVGGRAAKLRDGVALAATAIDSGAAHAALEKAKGAR